MAKSKDIIHRAKTGKKASAYSVKKAVPKKKSASPKNVASRQAAVAVKSRTARFYSGSYLSPEKISYEARHGIPRNEINRLMNDYGVSVHDLSKVLEVTEKTVRTYQHQDSSLSSQQGEQLLKYRHLLERGSVVFGSKDAFSRWLHKPAYGLDGERPMDLLVTSEGINLVADEVERIAYGEFA